MSWQFYTAVSVLGLSISVVMQRILLHKNKTDPVAFSALFQFITALIITIFALFNGLDFAGFSAVWLPAIISIIFFGIGTVVYAKTLQHIEASAFSVLFATQAVWIMLLGVFAFNESITALQIVGTVLIFASVLLLIKNLTSLRLDKGTLYGLLTGLLYAIAITATAYVGRETDTVTWAALSFYGGALVSLLVKPSVISKIKPMLRGEVLGRLLLLGVFYAIGSVTMLFAYKYGTLTLVSPLRQTSIIVTVLLALILLRVERNRIARKLLAAAICFVGVVLIVI